MSTETGHGELQRALDASFEVASAFTRSLFDEDRWDAEEVASFVNRQRNTTIAVVTPSGQPHAAVVIAACLEDRLYFTVASESLLGRSLRQDATVAFTVSDISHAVMGRGTALLAARSVDDPDLIQRLAAVTEFGVFTPPGWDGLIYRIEIARIFAN